MKQRSESSKKFKAKVAGAKTNCLHCRYERPATDERCPICGYPWPWLKNKAADKPRRKK